MNYPSKEIVEKLREQYPEGTRVELVYMDDPYRQLPERAKGTVRAVDDIGTIHVLWDCGSTLGIAYGADSCRKVTRCPKCGNEYGSRPAAFGHDSKTPICPECGMRESLKDGGRDDEKIVPEVRSLGIKRRP